MKILFGIQATGNGHLSRSIELYQLLMENPAVEKISVVISGDNANLQVPFPIQHRYKGLSFSYGKSGNISVMKSFLKANLVSVMLGIYQIPFKDYDLVISDYEPISVWGAKLRGIPTVGLGNIFSIKSGKFTGKKLSYLITEWFTKMMCPVDQQVAMHYKKYNEFIFNPLIRKEIRDAVPTDKQFILIYLLSFTEEQIINFFGNEYFGSKQFVVYSKSAITRKVGENITIKPIDTRSFTEDIISCSGVITAGGFQTTAEALYLGKKLLCIPIKKQLEQQTNAYVLEELGVKVLKGLEMYEVKKWILSQKAVQIKFENDTAAMVNKIIEAA